MTLSAHLVIAAKRRLEVEVDRRIRGLASARRRYALWQERIERLEARQGRKAPKLLAHSERRCAAAAEDEVAALEWLIVNVGVDWEERLPSAEEARQVLARGWK